ncbi:uncharacterized protein N7469_005990 [Penicillium citrinum]|uniref:Nuclear pore complex subunit Nup133 n=1 Tax=Penicillium citrinum TaxID=5077 RepID=A0A9W9NZH6_PENCI|nr:uncharacterized protein N7469_005990 [Penicillium citrinum]KAJ5231402.1 hypothetical protein N7469_005990 [Penicillium citrinum]
MFAPRATRLSRRRQRTSSDDSVGPPKAKRQRSVLRQSGDTTAASLSHENDAESQPVTSFSSDHGIRTNPTGIDSHLPIRGAKPSEGPKEDSEGMVVLSSTDYYTVNQLPALPDQIRGSQSDPLKCFFAPGHNHALALTHSHAIVWPYSVATSSPSPSETFTVSIPESCRDPYGPVPLGALVSTATGEHPGLLVIIPSTGKIVYWETVSSAASLALSRQKQNGIQGSTPGLLSGEVAVEVMNCEPSGLIVTFSSGRVAHVTLRDPQGKPSVLVNFLRSTGGGGGGLLGGLKNVLGGGYWRKEVTAVRPGGSRQRGQRDVLVATSTGLIEIWNTHWHHGSAMKKKFDIKEEIATALPSNMKSANEIDLKVLDFAFSTQGSDEQESNESWGLYVVVTTPQSLEAKTVFVVQLQLSGNEARIQSTFAVGIHSIPVLAQDLKPKILVSSSEDTAFIIFGQSLVILSLSSIDDSPTSQLLHDSQKLPLPFQDIIHLRSGKEFEILGYGSEERSEDNEGSSCLIMIRNFGVVRVDVTPQYSTEHDVEEGPVTAKHKLEQAIFFGTMAKNPLNLVGDGGLNFPPEEIEQASLDICRELLQSETRFIPSTAISIDQNLRLRAKALSDLASLLSKKGNPLGRTARWELLWGAEKLASQRAMWKLEESLRTKNEGHFLGQVIDSMNDKFKTRPTGDIDPVRQWFLKDTYQMEHIIPWIKHSVKSRKGGSKQSRKNSEQILEASELFLAVTETAFRYRDDHASMYGLGDDFVEDGVLADGYDTLPEFWTSRRMGYTEAGDLLEIEIDSALSWVQQKKSSADAPDGQIAKRLAENSARHLRVVGQMHRERTRWLSAQDDTKLTDESVSIEQSFVKERKWSLFKLAGIGHLQDAIFLAERFRDMEALVELILELCDQVKDRAEKGLVQDSTEASVFGVAPIGNSVADVERRVAQYFDKFGEPWSDAYFTRQISMGNPGALLSMRKYQRSVTSFLRKSPAYAKLSWMNDVTGEDDYESAAACLENLAIGSETKLWNHHVEISLAKLSKLASIEKNPPLGNNSAIQEDISRLDDSIAIDETQDKLYYYIRPFTDGAIDHKAEQELALDYFGGYLAPDRPSLHEILGDALSTLVNRNTISTDGLLDILTLIGYVEVPEDVDNDLCGREFYQALRVLDHSRYAQRDPSYVSALRKLIWRRCMIKDDWDARGKAAEGVNGDSDSATRDTTLYQTLLSCLTEPTESSLPSLFEPLSPADALMVESESDILVSRFRPEQRVRVATDLQREDDILRDYIQTGKLDFWFQNLLESVESQVSVPADIPADNVRVEVPTSHENKARLKFV